MMQPPNFNMMQLLIKDSESLAMNLSGTKIMVNNQKWNHKGFTVKCQTKLVGTLMCMSTKRQNRRLTVYLQGHTM